MKSDINRPVLAVVRPCEDEKLGRGAPLAFLDLIPPVRGQHRVMRYYVQATISCDAQAIPCPFPLCVYAEETEVYGGSGLF